MKFMKQALAAALLSAAAASSMAAVIYSQDFSKGLQTNETLTGKWAIADGKLARGPYQVNELSTFYVSLDLSGYKDVQLSFDWWTDTERCCDVLQLYTRDDKNTNPRVFIASGQGNGTFSDKLASNVKLLEFSFVSDVSIVGKGVSLDNILVTGTAIAPPRPLPEPGPVALLGAGLAALVLRRRMR